MSNCAVGPEESLRDCFQACSMSDPLSHRQDSRRLNHEVDSVTCRLYGKCILEALEYLMVSAQWDLAIRVCLDCNCPPSSKRPEALHGEFCSSQLLQTR